MFQTYQAWRRKLKQLYPTVTFEGDKDICQAFANGKGVGEWDGAQGEIYPAWTPAPLCDNCGEAAHVTFCPKPAHITPEQWQGMNDDQRLAVE